MTLHQKTLRQRIVRTTMVRGVPVNICWVPLFFTTIASYASKHFNDKKKEPFQNKLGYVSQDIDHAYYVKKKVFYLFVYRKFQIEVKAFFKNFGIRVLISHSTQFYDMPCRMRFTTIIFYLSIPVVTFHLRNLLRMKTL